jgi:hypothetical protein
MSPCKEDDDKLELVVIFLFFKNSFFEKEKKDNDELHAHRCPLIFCSLCSVAKKMMMIA